jgi:putative transposase
MTIIEEITPMVGSTMACAAFGVPRSSYYRCRVTPAVPRPARKQPTPARALKIDERQEVLETLHSRRFVDQAPPQVYNTLLDEGVRLCSVRTMYRILAAADEVRERRNQLRHPVYAKPELIATAPNQVWSWDLTKLRAVEKWTYYYLYVLLDIYSRYVVGWMLAHYESGELAAQLIEEACAKQGVSQDQLVIHNDRGSAPTSKTLGQKLIDLGVTQSFGRPRVSNDNPFSEAHFKTFKYQPTYPDRFHGYDHGLAYCREFFPWYCYEHRHSGIAMLTPADVHYGRAEQVLAARQRVLDQAYAAHPERFVNGPPKVPALPRAVWINPPEDRARKEMELH